MVGLDVSKTSPVSPERQQMTDAYRIKTTGAKPALVRTV